MGTGVQTEHRGCFSQGQVNVLVWEGFLFYSQAAGSLVEATGWPHEQCQAFLGMPAEIPPQRRRNGQQWLSEASTPLIQWMAPASGSSYL